MLSKSVLDRYEGCGRQLFLLLAERDKAILCSSS